MITYLQLLDTQQEKTVFAVLYEKYHRQLYNRAMHLVKDSAAAEDLVHETFLTVTKNMDKIMGADYMKNWGYLLTILPSSRFPSSHCPPRPRSCSAGGKTPVCSGKAARV